MLRSALFLRLATSVALLVTVQSASAAAVAFSFTGSVNYMSKYSQAGNSVSRVTSSMFAGDLIEENDVFTGAFYFDDNPPLGPVQQVPPEGSIFLRYMAPAQSAGLSIASTRNGLTYSSQSSSEFFVNETAYSDSVNMFNYSDGQRFVQHGGIAFYGPAGILQDGHVPGTGQLLSFTSAGFSINWVDIATGDQLLVNGLINSLTPAAPTQVPEPLTPALFGLAAVMALVARRLRVRQ